MTAAARAVGRARRGEHGEDGTVSVFVLVLVVALMVVAGLVVDGGRAVNGRAAAMDSAEQAARAGANQVDLATLRTTGEARLDPAAAQVVAVDYLVARGYDAARITATADAAQVTVTVRDDIPTTLLSLIFIRSFEVEGVATARAALGIADEITGAP
ncbi:MAG TPA: pilus assembly protein TadG-related protein [Cellulomonas sp.]